VESFILKCVFLLSISQLLFGLGNKDEAVFDQSYFNWRMSEGDSLHIHLNQHPLGEAIIRKLPEFESLTGIKVIYTITPEDDFFEKLSHSLDRGVGSPDVFMVGAYQIWRYSFLGQLENLDTYIENPSTTIPNYDEGDFFPEALHSLRWDGIPGHRVGTGPLWGLPLVFETNSLAYNKRIFDERGLSPPKTYEELIDLCEKLKEFGGPDTYPLALRGSRHWSTIHAGYMTTFVNHGASDFKRVGGELVSQVDSRESVEATQVWVDLIRKGGAPNWKSYSWYQAGADFGAGKAAMLFDADNNGFYQNQYGSSKEAENIRWVEAPTPTYGQNSKANLWVWALSMNSASSKKTAAWLFIQYFTSRDFLILASKEYKGADPSRRSVFDSPGFQSILEKSPSYGDVLLSQMDQTKIWITPQPYYMETAEIWSGILQDIASGRFSSTREGMEQLKQQLDEIVSP